MSLPATLTAPTDVGPTRFIEYPEVNKEGRAKPESLLNMAALLEALDVGLRFNSFTSETEIRCRGSYRPVTETDVNVLWTQAHHHALHVKPNDLLRLLDVEAHRHMFHPVLDYLRALNWDVTPRMDTWLSVYLGAAATPLNAAIGRSVLLGMVRRVLEPGCMHDTMMILEGPQGAGKSRAFRILGGSGYGDSLNLGQASKEVIEQTRGVWLGEIAELAGQRRNEVEMVKAFITRRTDKARLSYARVPTEVPRQFIIVGTTNDLAYLKDATGARRFLPVTVGEIDLAALARDRDQLLAEAYSHALSMADLGQTNYNAIPSDLWAAAAEAQESRRELTAIESGVREILSPDCCGYIAKPDLREALGARSAKDWTQIELNALNTVMRKMGWTVEKQRRPGGSPDNVWTRVVPGLPAPWRNFIDGKLVAIPPASAKPAAVPSPF